MHFFVNFVKNKLPPTWRRNSTGWTSGNCPMCVHNGESRNDTKQRGGFHFGDDEWVYNCFNCKYVTGWKSGSHIGFKARQLLIHLGVDEYEIQKAALDLLREEETAKLLNPMPEEKAAYIPNWPEVKLPEGAKYLLNTAPTDMHTNFEKGIEMLGERDLLHWHDWAYTSDDFKYRKRIILPYRHKGNIVGHNARFIGKPPEGTPKYLVTKPKDYVFNLDNQHRDRSFVIVTEGDFDAITTDGVAVGTNTINENQASLINQLKRKVIVLPDADQAGNMLIETAITEGWHVAFPEWMEIYKDANEASKKYGRVFVIQSIINSAIKNPTKIRLLAKRYLK